jgi:hypothetical protein
MYKFMNHLSILARHAITANTKSTWSGGICGISTSMGSGIGVAGGTRPGVAGGKPGVGGGTPGVGGGSNGAGVGAGVGTMPANWAASRASAPSTAMSGTSDCNKGCWGVGGGRNCWGVAGGGRGVGAINCCRSTWSAGGRSPCGSANFLLTLREKKWLVFA